jgi:hypothetical protein
MPRSTAAEDSPVSRMAKSGRPKLDPSDVKDTKVCVAMPAAKYDALYKDAQAARCSVPELLRRRALEPRRRSREEE